MYKSRYEIKEMNIMRKVLQITHLEDMDGLACGFLGEKAIPEMEVRLCDYINSQQVFTGAEEFDEIYITDLGVRINGVIANEIQRVVNINNNVKIVVVDHHEITLSWKRQMEEEGELVNNVKVYVRMTKNSKYVSAAYNFYEYLIKRGMLKSSPVLWHYVQAISDWDTWEWISKGNYNELALYLQKAFVANRGRFNKLLKKASWCNPESFMPEIIWLGHTTNEDIKQGVYLVKRSPEYNIKGKRVRVVKTDQNYKNLGSLMTYEVLQIQKMADVIVSIEDNIVRVIGHKTRLSDIAKVLHMKGKQDYMSVGFAAFRQKNGLDNEADIVKYVEEAMKKLASEKQKDIKSRNKKEHLNRGHRYENKRGEERSRGRR